MNLMDYIKKHKISADALAEKAGITTPTLYHAINGRNITLDTVVRLGYATNGKVKPADFIKTYVEKNNVRNG